MVCVTLIRVSKQSVRFEVVSGEAMKLNLLAPELLF